MPQVSSKSQIQRSGTKSKVDILRDQPTETPRDDLRGAYAGDENKGPVGDQKSSHVRSTSLSGRRIDKKRDEKEPVR